MPHAKPLQFFLIFLVFSVSVTAQNLSETHSKIRAAIESKDFQTAFDELQNLKQTQPKIFALNNYDYLLARIAEKQGDFAAAMANYQAAANRNSILSEYALAHLAQIAGSSGNLMLERIYLRELSAVAPDGLLQGAAEKRLARSYFESKDFAAVVALLNQPSTPGVSHSSDASDKETHKTNESQKPKTEDRENSILLGEALLRSGKTGEAREIFTKLITTLPNPAQPDDFALTAVKNLDELDGGKENFGKIAPPLDAGEHLRRALIYQFNRNFPLARLHFKAIVEKYPGSEYVPHALYQTGRTFAQEGNFDEAINWFERVQAEFPDNPVARDALSQSASAFSRVNKPKEAVARYQKFIEKYPDAENLERAYLNIVDILRDRGENQNALKWTAKAQEVFRGKLPEALALFAGARIRISQNDWANALNDLNALQNFSDLGGTRVPGGTNRAEITFLKGFVLENLNRYNETIDTYLSIPDGRNEYYGWRATERLKVLANDEKTKAIVSKKFESLQEISKQNVSANNADHIRQATQSSIRLLSEAENADESLSANMTKRELLSGILRQTYAILPSYQKIPTGKLLDLGRKEALKDKRAVAEKSHQALADELLFLGLYDEAAPELEISQSNAERGTRNAELKTEDLASNPQSAIRNPQSKDFAYTLAVFYRRGDMANRAVAYIEPLWKNVPADYEIELIPRDQLELLYPAPYSDSLLKFAPEKAVDPRFILAIMRQESRYRPDVKSNAAARGLLQFISTTADKLAGELGRENFNQDELYNPPTAILFGAQYLANLFRQFPNQPAAVAASYNGGEDNMTRWLARSKSDDADRYVSEIIFSQSKDYVYKVMANYRVYQKLYDEQLKIKN